MRRSLAGQIEHWAELGRALEAIGISGEDIRDLFYRARIATSDPMVRLIRRAGNASVVEVPASELIKAKRIRQRIDYAAQRDGLVAWERLSPFSGAKLKASLKEVSFD